MHPCDGIRELREIACGAVGAQRSPTRRGRLIDAALWTATVALALTTLLLSFALTPPGAAALGIGDKVGHGITYFATFLCLLLAAVWRPGRGAGSFPTRTLLFAIGVVIAGIVIEVLQEVATDARRAEVGDVLAEAIGTVGALAVHTWMRRTWGAYGRPTRAPT
jgi:hypothetical protein